MKRSQLFILLGFCLFLGLGLGYLLHQPDQLLNKELLKTQELLLSEQEQNLRYDLAKKKIELFTEKQMIEYHHLIDQKEKYKKADDILSRVMLIFLADLGIHLSSKNKKWIRDSRIEKKQVVDKENSEKVIRNNEIITNLDKNNKVENNEEDLFLGMEKEPFEKSNIKDESHREMRKFRRFFDKLGKKIKSFIRFDKEINILSANKIYKGETKPANKNLITFFLGKRKGLFRRGTKTNLKSVYHLKLDTKATELEYRVKLKFNTSGDSYTAIQLNDSFEAVHPISHNSRGQGPCRFLILKGSNGLRLYLTFIKAKNMIFGRVLNINNKKPTLGFFLLEKLKSFN